MIRDGVSLRLYIWPAPYPSPGAFIGVVSSSVPRSSRTIPVSSISSRWPEPGEIVYVGTAPGQYDIGILRVISSSRTSGTVTVSENEIDWSPGQYLYAPWLFAPTVRLQRIVEEGGNPVIYKDYDIAFNPSAYLPPKANISGPVDGGVGDELVYELSGIPMQYGTSIATYQLDADDGEVTPLPGNQFRVVFSTPGFRYVRGTVVDSAGQSGVIRVPVFVGVESFPVVSLSEMSGEVNGGWRVRLTFPYAEGELLPHSLVVMVGLDSPVVGWLFRSEIRIENAVRTAEVEFRSALSWLHELRNLGIQIEDSSSPSSWYFIRGLNVRRAIHHLLEWHTTYNQLATVIYDPIYSERPIKIQRFQDGSVGRELSEILDDASLVAGERTDGLLAIFRPPIWLWDRSGVTTVDAISGPVRAAGGDVIGQLRCGGFAYDTPLLSRYPGDVPLDRSRKQETEGLIVENQLEINRLCGLRWSAEAAGDVYATLAEPGDNFNFGPYWIRLADGVEMWMNKMSIRLVSGTILTDVAGKLLNPLRLGETMTVPQVPAPTPPEWPIPGEPGLPPYAGFGLALVRTIRGVYRSRNIYSYFPIWEKIMDLDVLESSYPESSRVTVDFRYVERAGTVAVVVLTQNGLYRTNDVGADFVVWERVLSIEQIKELVGSEDNPAIYWLMTLVNNGNHIGFWTGYQLPGYNQRTSYVFTSNWGATWNVSVLNTWFPYRRAVYGVVNTGGTNELLAVLSSGIAGSASLLWRSTDAGATWSQVGTMPYSAPNRHKMVKPWQYGVDGQIVYSQIAGYQHDFAAGKSVDRGLSYTELLPDTTLLSTLRGIEGWTYDPLHVCFVVVSSQSPNYFYFYVTRDGGASFLPPVLLPITPGIQPVWDNSTSLRGNPLNRQEWTVLRSGQATSEIFRYGTFLIQSLDGGATWRSLMGNFYDVAEIGADGQRYFTGKDYLITPPFQVVTELDLE